MPTKRASGAPPHRIEKKQQDDDATYGFTTCVVGSLTKYQASYAKLFIYVPIVLPWSQFSCKRPCHAGSNPLITHQSSSTAAGRAQVPCSHSETLILVFVNGFDNIAKPFAALGLFAQGSAVGTP
jgi:hypothetical protein